MLCLFSDDFAVMIRYFFGIDFGIDFVDLQDPQVDPWDNILGQGASKKHWAVVERQRRKRQNDATVR